MAFIGIAAGAGTFLLVLLPIGMLILFVIVSVFLVLRYRKPRLARIFRRHSAARPKQDTSAVGSRTATPYCLILRSFGRDGDVVFPDPLVPKGPADRRPRRNPVPTFVRTRTTEQVIALASGDRGLDTRSIVDPRAMFAPRNLDYESAEDADWQVAAGKLINSADAIAILLQPMKERDAARLLRETAGPTDPRTLLTPGLIWEISEIKRMDRANLTMLVLPPPSIDPSYLMARWQAAIILAVLSDHGLISGGAITALDTNYINNMARGFAPSVFLIRFKTCESWHEHFLIYPPPRLERHFGFNRTVGTRIVLTVEVLRHALTQALMEMS
jgi:hypothetical protein